MEKPGRLRTEGGLNEHLRRQKTGQVQFLQPDWFEVTQAGVGTNRYAYAGNDPVNQLDPGGNAYCGDTIGESNCVEALRQVEETRDALTRNIALAEQELARRAEGRSNCLFCPGRNRFVRNFEASYGDVTDQSLQDYIGLAQGIHLALGPSGSGAKVEHLGDWEDRMIDDGFASERIDQAADAKVGSLRFSNPDGLSSRFSGHFEAAAWARIGRDTIYLGKGWNPIGRGPHVFAHESGHLSGLRDFHELADSGYGRRGIAAALAVGVEWQSAESFACTLRGC